MSAISSAYSSAQSLYQQQLQRSSTSQSGPPDPQADFKARIESAARATGVDPAQIPGLENQIQQAVQGALQNAGGSGDKRAAVSAAVDSVLKNNGIDPAKFKSKLEAARTGAHKHRGGHHAKSASAGVSTAPGVTDPLASPADQDPLTSVSRVDLSA